MHITVFVDVGPKKCVQFFHHSLKNFYRNSDTILLFQRISNSIPTQYCLRLYFKNNEKSFHIDIPSNCKKYFFTLMEYGHQIKGRARSNIVKKKMDGKREQKIWRAYFIHPSALSWQPNFVWTIRFVILIQIFLKGHLLVI